MSNCRLCKEDKEGGVWTAGGFTCMDEPCWSQYLAESAEQTRLEIAKLTEQGLCYFFQAWIGRCKQPGSPLCETHSILKCSSCGGQATHDCPETMGFVCGFPLCDDCEHKIAKDGTNGGLRNMKHCKKGEQVFKPWFEGEAV